MVGLTPMAVREPPAVDFSVVVNVFVPGFEELAVAVSPPVQEPPLVAP